MTGMSTYYCCMSVTREYMVISFLPSLWSGPMHSHLNCTLPDSECLQQDSDDYRAELVVQLAESWKLAQASIGHAQE